MAVLSLIISQFQLESDLIRQKLWPEIHLTGFLTKCLKKDKVDKKWLPYPTARTYCARRKIDGSILHLYIVANQQNIQARKVHIACPSARLERSDFSAHWEWYSCENE